MMQIQRVRLLQKKVNTTNGTPFSHFVMTLTHFLGFSNGESLVDGQKTRRGMEDIRMEGERAMIAAKNLNQLWQYDCRK